MGETSDLRSYNHSSHYVTGVYKTDDLAQLKWEHLLWVWVWVKVSWSQKVIHDCQGNSFGSVIWGWRHFQKVICSWFIHRGLGRNYYRSMIGINEDSSGVSYPVRKNHKNIVDMLGKERPLKNIMQRKGQAANREVQLAQIPQLRNYSKHCIYHHFQCMDWAWRHCREKHLLVFSFSGPQGVCG